MSNIGIVILHWRNYEETFQLLQKLLKWKQGNFTIFLVQNETEEDAFEDLNPPNMYKLFSKENTGFGGGNNIGIHASIEQKLDFTLLLNTDAYIDEKELQKMIVYLEKNTDVFSVGPKLIEYANGSAKTYIGGKNIAAFSNTRMEAKEAKLKTAETQDVFYTIGAIMLLNNQHFAQVGVFDTSYFFSGEAADLCYRASKIGLKNKTVLNAVGEHFTEDSTARQTLYKYYSLRNRFLFIRKHNLVRSFAFKWWKILIKELLHSIIYFDTKQIRTNLICMYDVLLRTEGNQNHKFKSFLPN